MNKLSKLSLAAFVLAIAFGLILTAVPGFASSGTFDLVVKHNINGRALGLDKDLTVDIWVNGAPFQTDVTFKDKLMASPDAGNYLIEVKPAGSDYSAANVMELGPIDIPADVTVYVAAHLDDAGNPYMKVRIK